MLQNQRTHSFKFSKHKKMIRNIEVFIELCLIVLKQPLGMTSIFVFYFRTEVVYPTDHVFIFFRIFIFL